MKKILSLIVLFVCISSVTNAYGNQPIFGKYGFTNHDNNSDFQQYIGKTVLYLPCSPLNYDEKEIFNTKKFIPETEYVITDISPLTGNTFAQHIITITFQEKNGKKKLKMRTYVSRASDFPFLFIDDFNADKTSMIGKTYTDPLIKGEYKITDMKLEKKPGSERIKEVMYYVSNAELNRSFVSDKLERTLEEYLADDRSGKYSATLVKVEKPENSSERYGEVKTIEEKGVTKYSFEDELIDIIIFCNYSNFSFKLTNKSQNSIKVVWDDAVIVDHSGSTSKVMHSGIRYSQRDASQPASTIIRGASLDDVACPTSNVRYSDVLKEWITETIYPSNITKETTQIRLMLPIQIKDVVNEYVFVFDVKYEFDHPERLK